MRLVTCFGVHLRLHWLFGPTLVLFGYSGRLKEALLLFILVLGHEMIHGMVALAYGMRPREIELLPVGGVIRFHGVLEHRPTAEAVVALVGPLFNVVLAGLGWLTAWLLPGFTAETASFIRINMVLACFNLLPALPLDGGRIVRAVLTMYLGYGRATRIVVGLSRGIGLLLMAGGLLSTMYGLTAAVLVFLGFIMRHHARHELLGVPFVLLSYLAGPDPMQTPGAVRPVVGLATHRETTLDTLLPWLIPGKYHLFHVGDGTTGQAETATEQQFRIALFRSGLHTPVSALVRPRLPETDGDN